MNNRVVITGLGIVSPNGIGIQDFKAAIKNGVSGIRYDEQLAALKYSCQISGKPILSDEILQAAFTPLELRSLESTAILYSVIAALEAWGDAGLAIENNVDPDWDTGTIFGTGTSGLEKIRSAIYRIDALEVRKLGSSVVAQCMASGVSAFIGGKLGLGNLVTTNSSACITGTESILQKIVRFKFTILEQN